MQYFYTPSWVLSQLLIAGGGGDNAQDEGQMNNYRLIAEFYHYFATNSTLYKAKEPIPEKKPSPNKKIDRNKFMTKDDWKMRIGM